MSCLPVNGQFSSQALFIWWLYRNLTPCTSCLLVEQYFLMFAQLLFDPGFGNTRLTNSWEAHCTTSMKRGFASAAAQAVPRFLELNKPNHPRAYVIIRRMLRCLDPREMRGQ